MGIESEGQSDLWNDIVPRVDAGLCLRCDDCAAAAACLAQGFRREKPDEVPVVDENRCFGCYSCVGACPYDAVIMPRFR
jgi:Fe-S-cluster-containing hydrogenase component 2